MRTRSQNLTPEAKRTIGEYAAKNGVTAAVRKYRYCAGSVSKCKKEYGQQNLLTVNDNAVPSPSLSRYTQEFRQQLATSWVGVRNYAEVARRYDVDADTVRRAVKDFVAEEDITSTRNDEQNTSEFENKIESLVANVEERLERLAKRIDSLSSAVEIMTDVVFEKAETLEKMRSSHTND